jgi:hypothetical protein
MWEDVLKEAYGGRDEAFIAHMLEFRNVEACGRACLRVATSRQARALKRRLAKPLAELERVYWAIQKVFNCEIIVDSSKHSMYAYILQLADGIDPYILHLTRDPRASAYSFLRKRVLDGRLLWIRDRNPLDASLRWNFQNAVIEVLSKRFRHRPLHVRYEDFVANPRVSLQRVLTFVGETRSSFPLHDEHIVNLEAQHTVSGNPSRFVTGDIELRENHDWKNEMKRRDRMLVTALTWPLLIKYGYQTRTGASAGARETHSDQNAIRPSAAAVHAQDRMQF